MHHGRLELRTAISRARVACPFVSPRFYGVLNYDLAPDGKSFAIFPELTAPAEEKGSVHIAFLLNFFDELRRRAPVGAR